jgi:hypothetical protein
MEHASDEIVLTLPRERRFYDVAHLVVSGLASRLNLTVDNLADLQLALAGLLPRRETEDGEITVVLRIDGELLDGRIGPFDPEIEAELDRVGGEGFGTSHVLGAVFDSYRVAVEGDAAWVHFVKSVTPVPEA